MMVPVVSAEPCRLNAQTTKFWSSGTDQFTLTSIICAEFTVAGPPVPGVNGPAVTAIPINPKIFNHYPFG